MTVGADQGEIADVGSPVDIAAAPARIDCCPLRWATSVIATAAALLALADAGAIVSWLDEMPPGRIGDRLQAPVAAWNRATTGAGLNAPRATMHRWWQSARTARFGSEQPGAPGTD